MRFIRDFALLCAVAVSLVAAAPSAPAPYPSTPEHLAEWALDIAPLNLGRLESFRASRTLTPEQGQYVDRVKSFVLNMDFEKGPEVEAACAAVFEEQDCKQILHGSTLNVFSARGEQGLKARDWCGCSTNSDLCTTPPCSYTTSCQTYYGCGVLFYHLCNGRCLGCC